MLLKEGKVYFGSQFESAVCDGVLGMATEASGG